MSKEKKTLQLGMNPRTAQGRLVKDTLFKLAVESGHTCYQCGGELTRDTFSIEHKEPWLDSEDPVGLFFDQDNIGFSHLKCNVVASRPKPKSEKHGTVTMYSDQGCRCDLCKKAKSEDYKKKYYTSEKRREKYLRLGT